MSKAPHRSGEALADPTGSVRKPQTVPSNRTEAEKARVVQDKLLDDDRFLKLPEGPFRDIAYALAYEEEGVTLRAQGDLAGALHAYRKTLEFEERLAKGSKTLSRQDQIFTLHEIIGDILKDQGKLTFALESYGTALLIGKRGLAADYDNIRWKHLISALRLKIAGARHDQRENFGEIETARNPRKKTVLSSRAAISGSDAGDMPSDKRDNFHDAIAPLLTAERVPHHAQAALIAEFRSMIERARSARPSWRGRRERGGGLATLTAPQYLKEVYPDKIDRDGTVRKDVIRALDPDLMDAIETYVSKRSRGEHGLGDAEGLTFVATRPARNANRAKRVDVLTK